ncbi:putative protozoan/cyanobacterial globin family; truncated hemoglobin protein trHb [Bradyrhizobium sp. STM 3843]|uniref:group II truncated hemoglobin n=1 Tax=unclassified Bradyrhizobium TaxID=2631580 RepID=UPI000240A9E1|nr:group II truncated hemoglobin [Bradyrhizobium sp. STM 3843]CCE05081.1 putative protozoan/cyanobacterial globin family; truncated hemoglobin protein trHb [Bradyrhizobium sp. STM 3843]
MTSADATDDAAIPEATPYELIGGEPIVRRLADRFYEIMDSDPAAQRIRAMHGADLGPIRQMLFEFLSGWLGGPPLYFDRTPHRCIMSAHRPYPIGEVERDEWMKCMRAAMDDCDLPADMRALLDQAFQRMANVLRSR